MNKNLTILSIIVILILLGGFAYWQMSNTVEEDNLVNFNQSKEQVDISDWVTYRNEEFGFEFKYPEGWDAPEGWKDVLIIKITKSEDLNNDILELKNVIKKNKTQNIIQLDKLTNAQLDVYYTSINGAKYSIVQDVLYGSKFFIDNDLIEISIILPRETNFNLPEEKEELDLFIQQIREGNAEDKINEMMIRFNEVLLTFIFF